ncbi:MAG: hypothetical protein IT384_14310 [Deltaproteobacteria bacterium]|nr:hypothetical protein [Deltaproteobacteria bacterium]
MYARGMISHLLLTAGLGLLFGGVAAAQQPGELKPAKKTPLKVSPQPAAKPPPSTPLRPTPGDFDDSRPVELEALVHSVAAHRAILGLPIDAKGEQDLLRLGYKKVGSPEQIGHRTIYDGHAYAERMATDEEVFARLRPGTRVKIEVRRTREGTMVIAKAS